MPRFFMPESFSCPADGPLPESITMEGENAFHLSVSLRCRIGESVTVCTAEGVEILCRILSVSGGKKNPSVLLEPLKATSSDAESPVSITVYQGMPKGKKTDSIIQKCTELGADRIVFVYSDRSVPVMNDADGKCERFNRIAMEAAKQCGRAKTVEVRVLPSVDRAVEEMKESELSFFCYEQEDKLGIKSLLSTEKVRTASFFIGPEGGISPREAELFFQAKIPAVTLGRRILRTETAATVVLSMFLFEKEL